MNGRRRMSTPTSADTVMSATSYAGAGASIVAGLTLTEWGVIVGIVTAVVTLAANLVYQVRKDQRERRLWKLQVRQLEGKCDEQ